MKQILKIIIIVVIILVFVISYIDFGFTNRAVAPQEEVATFIEPTESPQTIPPTGPPPAE